MIFSSPLNLPLHLLDRHLFATLLVIVKPLAIRQRNTRELRAGVRSGCEPVALGNEGDELEAATVEFEQLLGLGRVGLLVGGRGCLYVGGGFALWDNGSAGGKTIQALTRMDKDME